MSYVILSDTPCNLPLSRVEKDGVRLIPFNYYAVNDSEHVHQLVDIDTFDGKAFYDEIRSGRMYNTYQIAPQDYYDFFLPYAKEGKDILYICMSSGISGSYNSAQIAKEMIETEFPACTVVVHDTLAASLGEGIHVLKAIEYRDRGMSLDECYQALLDLRECTYQTLTVGSLRHLQRTGRLSNAAAILGTLLNLRPILKGNEKGQIVSVSKVRGNKNAIIALAKRYNELVENASEQVVGIAHSDNQADADMLAELLREKFPPREILTVCYEPVTGSHVGPETIALFFLGKPGVRAK